MLGFLFKGKKKGAMRSQVVESFIDNLVRYENGDDNGEKSWAKCSFDNVIEHFDRTLPDPKFSTMQDQLKNWVGDVENPTFCDAYNVIHNVYFGSCATEYEKDKVRYEFKNELKTKNLREAFDRHSGVKWEYYEKK